MSTATIPLYGKFEEVVDAPAGAQMGPQVECWEVTAEEVTSGREARLDALSYEPGLTEDLDELSAGAKA